MKIAPTLEADKEVLSSFISLGASFFPVNIYLDDETGKACKVPNVREWQKKSNFDIISKEQLGGYRAYGFHPETIGAYVIDLDDKGTDGEASLLEALGRPCEDVSSPSVYVDTPNGRHIYFSSVGLDDIRFSKNSVLPGVDIRAEHSGGWLVAPGSVGYSYKRSEWQLYQAEGDFSSLPTMPEALHALLKKLVSVAAAPDVLPSFLSPATEREVLTAEPLSSDPRIEKLFELAAMACRANHIFCALVDKYVPASKYDGRDYLTGDYEGNPGSSCHWTPQNGLIKDFNDPLGKGGDFIWWLHTYRNMTNVDAARVVLSVAGFPDPSHGPTLEGIKEEARAQSQAVILAPINGEYPLTDSGNAERLVAELNGNLLYNTDQQAWLAWNGITWEKDAGGMIQRLSKKVARSMALAVQSSEDTLKAAKLAKWAFLSESQARRDAMCKLAQHEDGVAVAEDDFNRDIDVINTLSGKINVKTLEVFPHDKADKMTQLCPYEVSYERPVRFLDFMQQIMERREDLLDWIHVYLGYCLTGHTNEQLFPIWWGSGANGKSQLLSIVGGILGNYCKPVSSETFLQNHSGSPVRDDLAILKGARFIWASEPDAGKVLSMSTVKLMTGSDPITCRHLYGRIFSYIPTYKPVFVTNHRPQVKSQDYGTWRRLRFIPFTYQVPTEDRIPDLALRLLEEEGDRILGWLLEGARRWYEEAKLPYCHDIEAATDGLRVGDDPLAEFIMERCIVDYSLVTPLDNVWREYTAWANEKNIRNVLSRTLLRHLLEERPSTMISTYSMKVMVKGLAIKAKME